MLNGGKRQEESRKLTKLLEAERAVSRDHILNQGSTWARDVTISLSDAMALIRMRVRHVSTRTEAASVPNIVQVQ